MVKTKFQCKNKMIDFTHMFLFLFKQKHGNSEWLAQKNVLFELISVVINNFFAKIRFDTHVIDTSD